MSRILALARNTLSYAAALYTPLDRHRQEAALQVFIMAVAFAITCTALLGWVLWELDLYPAYIGGRPMDALYFLAFAGSQYIVESFLLLALFPFILAQRENVIGTEAGASFSGQVSRLPPAQWSSFLLASSVLFVLHLLLFHPLLMVTERNHGVHGSWDMPSTDGVSLSEQYADWAVGLIGSLFRLVPVLLLFLLLLSARRVPYTLTNLRERLPALAASLLSVLLLGIVVSALHGILQRHVFPLAIIPFRGSAFPLVLTFMVIALAGAFCTPFFAACVHRPLDSVEDGLAAARTL